jgi:hypothetical protein
MTLGGAGLMAGAWSRADKINSSMAIIALLGVLISLVSLADDLWERRHRPQVTIHDPANNSTPANRDFGASGSANNIPSGSDLYLMIRPSIEGRWYPVARLTIKEGGSWAIPKGVIDPASGSQEIQVFSVPINDAAQLLEYVNMRRKTGDDPGISGLPSSAALKAYSHVNVPKN